MSKSETSSSESACWVIVGPTASGKTAVSLELAERYPVEIISVDSMQVYRDMDIGTAKPAPEKRESVPHHMIDVVDPEEEYNVARYREQAIGTIQQTRRRGNIPLLICGTPFYLKALLWGLFEGPGADEKIRERLRGEAERYGSECLHAKLSEVDPDAAEKIDQNDLKRIERALEVYEITGEPISQRQDQFAGKPIINHISVGLNWDRQALYRRIERRVDEMLKNGLEEEVKFLQGRLGPQASQAVGYKELVSYFKGDISRKEAIRLIKRNTRHLAKSQISWFKRFPVGKWIEMNPTSNVCEIAQECAHIFLDQSAHPCTSLSI